jgi:hypothetical protein
MQINKPVSKKPTMDTIALIVGYAVLLSATVVLIIVSFFWITDKIAFRKYQKKGEKRIMDYACDTEIKFSDKLPDIYKENNQEPIDIFIVEYCEN